MSAQSAAANFGSMVRTIRKAKGLKSWQVAEKVDIEVKHLGRIERGEKQPSFDLIIALAEGLDVSPAKFFEFEPAAQDPNALRKQIIRQLKGRDANQLHMAQEVLTILFDFQ